MFWIKLLISNDNACYLALTASFNRIHRTALRGSISRQTWQWWTRALDKLCIFDKMASDAIGRPKQRKNAVYLRCEYLISVYTPLNEWAICFSLRMVCSVGWQVFSCLRLWAFMSANFRFQKWACPINQLILTENWKSLESWSDWPFFDGLIDCIYSRFSHWHITLCT